jgi:hypothetical protein
MCCLLPRQLWGGATQCGAAAQVCLGRLPSTLCADTAPSSYRTAYEAHGEARRAQQAALDGLMAAKSQLLSGYEAWSAANCSGGGDNANDGGSCSDSGDATTSGLDPAEAFAQASLARKAAAAGDPHSAAFFAAQRTTARLLGSRTAGRR